MQHIHIIYLFTYIYICIHIHISHVELKHKRALQDAGQKRVLRKVALKLWRSKHPCGLCERLRGSSGRRHPVDSLGQGDAPRA